MLSVRNQFILTSVAYLLLTPTVSAQGWWGGGNGDWHDGDGNWDGCPPWWSSDECSSNGGNSNGNNNGASADPSAYGLTESDLQRSNRILTIHAVLACLVWVLYVLQYLLQSIVQLTHHSLIPLGGILLRLGINSPWIVRTHAILQSLSYIIYIAAAALGIWLIRTLSYGPYSMWEDPHPKLGVAILALAFLQPIFGLIHHSIYKRRALDTKAGRPTKAPGRTVVGYIHLWLGRLLIVLGMINGGLGLRLAASSPFAGNNKTKAIAYGVGAGIMLLLYLIFVVFGEIRRSKNIKENQRHAAEASRNIPLMDAEGVQTRGPVPPTYSLGNVPPSYEDSQESLRKEAQTTARYQ
ncbi:hypothetical protein H2198_002856 [Neophaeococcomyces mojaviensis]|uniref:Uncharacterized protein n=1 Tax=Neophaeococcomyces mojaviensis TaxID=3383035 RepID=A0ACC3ADK1_9EURO|nr:hypothetical protein H2198_002856 [Knufia sp. JES_112]